MKGQKRQFRADAVSYDADAALRRAERNGKSFVRGNRHDSKARPGGPAQTMPSAASKARAAMIERGTRTPEKAKPQTVDELVQLFKNGKLMPEDAYNIFLELGDKSQMSAQQAKRYFLGREDSAGARERMLRRMGL